ncbi:MAG: hypothetical protein HY720_20340 [Planctomycetes bacterium]|nr:hypothetical protein [Planctomycetota bacterium]
MSSKVGDRTAEAREKIAGLAERLEELGAIEEPGEETTADVYHTIDRVYWDMCRQVLDEVVQGDYREKIVFPGDLSDFLCYGHAGLPQQEFLAASIERTKRFDQTQSPYRIVTVDSALTEACRRILLVDEVRRLSEERQEILRRIEEHPIRMERLFDGKMMLLDQVVRDAGTRERLRHQLTDWYSLLQPYIRMEKQVKDGGLSSRTERIRYIDFKERYTKLLEQAEEGLRIAGSSGGKMKQILEAMVEETQALVGMDKRLDEVTRELEKRSLEAEQINATQVRVGLEEEIAYLQSMAKMCAKWAQMPPLSIPLAQREVAEPLPIVETLAVIDEYDPGLFNHKVARKRGIPSILILPASGNGKYDWKNNRFLIPSLFPRTILESLASAAINYRDDVDRQSGDREMLNSFRETKEVRDLRSSIKIQNRLMDEYVNWIVKEAAGYQVMEKEIREWFEEHIGPDKNDVKLPKEYRTLSFKDIQAETERLAGIPESSDKYYRLAVLTSMKNKRDQEDQEAALRFIEKAVEQNASAPDYFYTLGILCRRTHKKKRATEAFRKYTQIAPQSWWSRKAQEHLVGL